MPCQTEGYGALANLANLLHAPLANEGYAPLGALLEPVSTVGSDEGRDRFARLATDSQLTRNQNLSLANLRGERFPGRFARFAARVRSMAP